MEGCLALDVNQLNKLGCLQPGYRGVVQWMRDGESAGSIGLRAAASQVAFGYRRLQGGAFSEGVEQHVSVRWSPCHFGGMRPYFLCPGGIGGRWCSRRVTKLYLGPRGFLCRHCYDLAYESQCEAWDLRLARQARKHRAALGGSLEAGSAVPPKPKGMHRRTYERHLEEIEKAEDAADQALADWRPHKRRS